MEKDTQKTEQFFTNERKKIDWKSVNLKGVPLPTEVEPIRIIKFPRDRFKHD